MSKEENHIDNQKNSNNRENISSQSNVESIEKQSTNTNSNDDKQLKEKSVLDSTSGSAINLEESTPPTDQSNSLHDQATDIQNKNDSSNQQSNENIENSIQNVSI
jgi:hypothetical protein